MGKKRRDPEKAATEACLKRLKDAQRTYQQKYNAKPEAKAKIKAKKKETKLKVSKQDHFCLCFCL